MLTLGFILLIDKSILISLWVFICGLWLG